MCNRNDIAAKVSHDTRRHEPALTMTTTTSTDSVGVPRNDDPRVERTRAAVIEAASDLLVADGPGAITHANVAQAANVSRTTVYNHWPTREDLLRAAIDSVGRVTPDESELVGPIRADLGTLCEHLVVDLIDDQRAPMIANMMERALHDSTIVSVRDEFLERFEQAFRVAVDRAIDRGELCGDVDVRRSIASIVGSFLFARFMSNGGFDRSYADAVLDDFVRVNAPH
jgi:AcrR family transcriptional regulator